MITEIDFKILDYLQSIRNPFFDAIFSFITHLGDAGIIWIVLAVVMLFFKKTRKCGVIMAIALIIGTVTGNLIMKNLFARERPFIANPDMIKNIIISLPSGYSFPSGHTMSSFECAFAIFLCNKKWGVPALILAFLIGFSRNYLYVHFPTDVIAGTILGIAVGALAYFIYRKFMQKKIKWL